MTTFRTSSVLVLLSLVWVVFAVPAGAQTQAPPLAGPTEQQAAQYWLLFEQAPLQLKLAALDHLNERYPNYTADLLTLIATNQPQFLAELDAHLERVMGKDYPRFDEAVRTEVGRIIKKRYPGFQQALEHLLKTKYAPLLEEIRKLPQTPDLQEKIRALVRDKYSTLNADVLLLMHQQFPGVLTELQAVLLDRFPTLVPELM
ncbi:MAG: hypothetical protein J7M26_00085, partial [Armatimonadetes bacterium]|nr:hypothetical protein [Armatimonadota bacterium]